MQVLINPVHSVNIPVVVNTALSPSWQAAQATMKSFR